MLLDIIGQAHIFLSTILRQIVKTAFGEKKKKIHLHGPVFTQFCG